MKIAISVIRILTVLGFLVFSSSAFSVTSESETELAQQTIFDSNDASGMLASQGRDIQNRFGMRIAGTYLVTRQPDSGPTRILNISADGNLTSIQSVQFGGGALGSDWFSNQHGTWKRVGKQRIAATVFDLSYESLTGKFIGTAIARYSLQFDDAFQTVRGLVEGEIFPPGIDPLNPGETESIADFSDTFQAQRLTVGN